MNSINKNFKKTYKLTDKFFFNIGKSCKNCNTCCKTYGWLLKQEAKRFSEKEYPVAEINKNLYCFDSFIRDKNNKRVFDRIPRCFFYKEGKCLIYKERPLDCRLYPIKVKFIRDKAVIGLSLGCKYISVLTVQKKEQFYRKITIFFKKAPQVIINNYLNLMEEVNSISKPKKFWMKKIMEFEKEGKLWKITK